MRFSHYKIFTAFSLAIVAALVSCTNKNITKTVFSEKRWQICTHTDSLIICNEFVRNETEEYRSKFHSDSVIVKTCELNAADTSTKTCRDYSYYNGAYISEHVYVQGALTKYTQQSEDGILTTYHKPDTIETFYDNGQLARIEIGDRDHRKSRQYYKNGVLKSAYSHAENDLEEYYENGKIKRVIKGDTTKKFNENGSLENWYVKDQFVRGYFANGNMKFETLDINDSITLQRSFLESNVHDEDGIYWRLGALYLRTYYENGNVHKELGPLYEKTYYPSGNIASITTLTDSTMNYEEFFDRPADSTLAQSNIQKKFAKDFFSIISYDEYSARGNLIVHYRVSKTADSLKAECAFQDDEGNVLETAPIKPEGPVTMEIVACEAPEKTGPINYLTEDRMKRAHTLESVWDTSTVIQKYLK